MSSWSATVQVASVASLNFNRKEKNYCNNLMMLFWEREDGGRGRSGCLLLTGESQVIFRDTPWKEVTLTNYSKGKSDYTTGRDLIIGIKHWKSLPRGTERPPSLNISKSSSRAWATWFNTVVSSILWRWLSEVLSNPHASVYTQSKEQHEGPSSCLFYLIIALTKCT